MSKYEVLKGEEIKSMLNAIDDNLDMDQIELLRDVLTSKVNRSKPTWEDVRTAIDMARVGIDKSIDDNQFKYTSDEIVKNLIELRC
jgi:hypothetical protein